MNKIAMTQSASRQALWFLLVGASAAGVHFLVLISVVSFIALSPAWANVVAFLVAFIVSFFGHFYLTFRQANNRELNSALQPSLQKTINQDNSTLNEYQNIQVTKSSWQHSPPILLKWFASSVIGFLANQSLFVLGLNWFSERYYMLIWLVVTGVITIMTFSLGKLWAFKS